MLAMAFISNVAADISATYSRTGTPTSRNQEVHTSTSTFSSQQFSYEPEPNRLGNSLAHILSSVRSGRGVRRDELGTWEHREDGVSFGFNLSGLRSQSISEGTRILEVWGQGAEHLSLDLEYMEGHWVWIGAERGVRVRLSQIGPE